MKNILKKNNIIITALAIMIIIAGYLSFTNNDGKKDDAKTAANPALEDYEEFTELEGLEVVTDTTGTDDTTDDTTGTDDTDLLDDTDATDEDTTLESTTDDNDETQDTDTLDDTDELGDISDDDILDVADNGELNLEDGVPGEAVLVSTTIDASYFITKKLDREQVRAKNKDTYMDIIQNAEISEELKKDAVDKMIELTQVAEKESAAEMLLEAKGFDGAVVFINDNEVDVVINAPSLSDQQLAIIEEVVKDKTDIGVEHININPVVVEE